MTIADIEQVASTLHAELEAIKSPADVAAFKAAHLTRKGTIATLFGQLRDVPKDEKSAAGKQLNDLRQSVEAAFAEREAAVAPAAVTDAPTLDLTMPARPITVTKPGHPHPLITTLTEMVTIFERMGFAVESGPEIEDEEHNFGKLNFPPDHPARDMQDTFFVKKSPGQSATLDTSEYLVLRTHTSPVQIRVMESQRPPIRAIMPGRVYRNEAISARSGVAFFQLEGLVVDRGVTMADLKGVLLSFARQFFGSDAKIRLRPSFFPFTEPSAEVDVSCYICGGKGCRVCKNSGWLEILGAGMVHPNVLRNCDIDPEIYTGYAFGMGIDRTAMMRYGITDIRDFFENDYRFLEQF